MSNSSLRREEKRKVTFRMGENEKKIDFVLIKKEHRQIILNLKEIPGDIQHVFVIVDINIKKIMKME